MIPEKHGGIGLTHLELCVIAEELGRAVAPVPFSSSAYLATEALLLAGSEAQREKWLPKLATGDAIGTFALGEGAGQPRPSNLATRAAGERLDGTKIAVPDGDIADFAVVVAGADSGDGASCLAELDGVERQTVRTLDPSRDELQGLDEIAAAKLWQKRMDAVSRWTETPRRDVVLFAHSLKWHGPVKARCTMGDRDRTTRGNHDRQTKQAPTHAHGTVRRNA